MWACVMRCAIECTLDMSRPDVFCRKGKLGGGISGVIDVLEVRGVSSRSSDNQSGNVVSKSHLLSLSFSGILIDLGCGPFYEGLKTPMVRHDLVLKDTSVNPDVSYSTSLEGNPLELSDP
jgi:hypothetical protein